ncbi:GbsR/MarR family transcriptional regulator, partial [Stackebrandtia sp.]|uniref:GbsR/MarR family transcriptional regulator n=1 Tax=Stackebrandtia sp. TaxID=2023065 RepID=UPI0039C92508
MPGPRLTHQDRHTIAAALTQGLGYAEIARRLHRPTSTISREVTRNGGRHHYRADTAHHNTLQRAHRHTPHHDNPPQTTTTDTPAIQHFKTHYTTLMTDSGMPPIMSKVLISLLTSETGSHTSAELVELLHVSPASISKSVRYLEQLGLLRRQREPHQRRERYIMDDEGWIGAWLHALQVHKQLSDAAQLGAEAYGPHTTVGKRLQEWSAFS